MTDQDAPKIAVIDDEASVCTFVERMLSVGGYQVVSTTDPLQAVDLVRRETPDLILCDIAMPEKDGYAVVRDLQADPIAALFPVAFLTTDQEPPARVEAFRFGIVDYIPKPLTRAVLLQRVARLLQGLSERQGQVEGPAGEVGVGGLLDDVHRAGRSGVLSTEHGAGSSRVLIRAGSVIETAAPGLPEPSTPAVFSELDPAREDIVTHDPSELPGKDDLASFESVPELLRTVLIVDDNLVFRSFLKKLLQARGFTVYEAADGEEGLRTALERRPWLILTDVRMPGIDGVELCKRVRGHALIRHTPLVILSGWDDYKDRYRSLEAGADEFVSKQTRVRELLIRIQLILGRFSEIGTRDTRTSDHGMGGRLDIVGASGVLQMCHLMQLTGVLTARSGTRVIDTYFREGEIINARSSLREGREAIFEFLSWTRGIFNFASGDAGPGEPLGDSFEQLLLEGCRQLDEANR